MWFLQLLFLDYLLKAVLYKTGRKENTYFLIYFFGPVDNSYITSNVNFSHTRGLIPEGFLLDRLPSFHVYCMVFSHNYVILGFFYWLWIKCIYTLFFKILFLF